MREELASLQQENARLGDRVADLKRQLKKERQKN